MKNNRDNPFETNGKIRTGTKNNKQILFETFGSHFFSKSLKFVTILFTDLKMHLSDQKSGMKYKIFIRDKYTTYIKFNMQELFAEFHMISQCCAY